MGFLETIQYFVKLAYKCCILMLEVMWLCHENFFLKGTIKEFIIYINLVHLPMIVQSKSKNNFTYGSFDHWRECIIEVKAKLLMIALGYKSSLVFMY